MRWLTMKLLLTGWLLVAFAVSAAAQPANETVPAAEPQREAAPAAEPAADAPRGQPLKINIVAVEGNVQVRGDEDQPWQRAEVGMTLGVGAEFRTGVRSAVRFAIPPDQTVTLDRLGVIKVLQALRLDEQKVKTDLGMMYGRAVYDVTDVGVEHEASIRSPSATLAVRGTYDMAMNTNNYHATQVSANRNQVTVGRPGAPDVNIGSTETSASMPTDADGVASGNLTNTILDPSSSKARQGVELTLVGRHQGTGGADVNHSTVGSRALTVMSSVEESVSDSLSFLTGEIQFLLMWALSTSDLDFSVVDTDGNRLCPFSGTAIDCVKTSPNGGVAGTDFTSGPATEVITFTGPNLRSGDFTATAHHFSSEATSTPFTITATQNGTVIHTFNDAVSDAQPTKSTVVNIQN